MKITKSDIDGVVKRLNILTKASLEPYTRAEDGKFHSNIGTYYVGGAYGGWKLERIVSDSGACSDPLRLGYVTKKELYNLIWAYIHGIEEAQFQDNK
jgi:hypothetical protein